MLDVHNDVSVLPGSNVGGVAKKELAVSIGKFIDDAQMDRQAKVVGVLLLVMLELSFIKCNMVEVFLCADRENSFWHR